MNKFHLGQRMTIGLLKAYRFFLSPWLGSACRFEPTCSLYSIEALQTHGVARGSYLTLKRLVRCQPWCVGGNDPVPVQTQTIFTRLILSPKAAVVAPESLTHTTEKNSS